MWTEFLEMASLYTPALLLILAWLLRTWIKAKLDDNLKGNREMLLEEIKKITAKEVALTESRIRVFSTLWEITKDLTPSEGLKLTNEEMEKKVKELRAWYYDKGNAMHLSLATTNDFLKGLQYLEKENSDENLTVIKRIFSSVRTRSKEDLGVYGSGDVFEKIPNYKTPLADGETVDDPVNKA